jgi:siroheme synthase
MAPRYTLPGKVYLSEAGSGQVRQMTRRVQELLQKADLVLHEDPVSEDVSALISVHASVQDVRKPIDGKKISPEEIQGRMIAAARIGKIVVRLKGSEPSSFGEAQEELAALREAGIEFEIVPGAAAAAASATGQMPPMERESVSKHVS